MRTNKEEEEEDITNCSIVFRKEMTDTLSRKRGKFNVHEVRIVGFSSKGINVTMK